LVVGLALLLLSLESNDRLLSCLKRDILTMEGEDNRDPCLRLVKILASIASATSSDKSNNAFVNQINYWFNAL
jgi:hypothetical protein